MTIFSPQKFHQKAKNPRKRPILSKFVVPKVPEVPAGSIARTRRKIDYQGEGFLSKIRKKYEKKQVCYC
jgi:hypothetical protein